MMCDMLLINTVADISNSSNKLLTLTEADSYCSLVLLVNDVTLVLQVYYKRSVLPIAT